MKKIVLFGAGGMGRETAELIRLINNKKRIYELVGFVVDKEYFKEKTLINGIPVLGSMDWLIEHKEEVCCNISVGDAKKRSLVFERIEKNGIKLETLISPDVYIPDTSMIGKGCLIQIGCRISTNVTIEDGVFLNSDVALGHDVKVHKCATIYSRTQVGGYAEIGLGAQVGSCCCLNPHSKIGDNAMVAPLSCVYGKVKPGIRVLGNPARKIDL